jgi:hypothetical protein
MKCILYLKRLTAPVIVPVGEWEKNPRLQETASVCPEGAEERNIRRLQAAVL